MDIRDVALIKALSPASSGSGGSGESVTVDAAMSTVSTNPVQNKVVTAKISEVEKSIPTALPTPKKLTFTGAVNAEFDGSKAVSVEIPSDAHINSLINTALGVIENGTY